MQARRVIPCLLLRGEGLVKTTRFATPTYVGDPINVVRIFNEKEVDEIVIFDILASRERRAPRLAFLEKIVSEAFMPVCYGGAVRDVDHARQLLRLGIEKLAVNTAALRDLGSVRRLSDRFGAQCVMGVVDVRRDLLGRARVHSHVGAPVPERDPVRWASALARAGAGEILVQSVDRDGTRAGMDLDLASRLRNAVPVPVVLAGGANATHDMVEAMRQGGLSGVAVGGRFVWYGPHRAVLVSYLQPGERREIAESLR